MRFLEKLKISSNYGVDYSVIKKTPVHARARAGSAAEMACFLLLVFKAWEKEARRRHNAAPKSLSDAPGPFGQTRQYAENKKTNLPAVCGGHQTTSRLAVCGQPTLAKQKSSLLFLSFFFRHVFRLLFSIFSALVANSD